MQAFIPGLVAALIAGTIGTSYLDRPANTVDTPYLSAGVGYFDVFDNAEKDSSMDYRIEYNPNLAIYRGGLLTVSPFVAGEATGDGSVYGLVGLSFDTQYHNFYITPSFGVGGYHSGSGKDMGSGIEFRTQIETGYEFDNQSRLGIALSHTSNADIGDTNPGAEVISVYYHQPVSFGW